MIKLMEIITQNRPHEADLRKALDNFLKSCYNLRHRHMAIQAYNTVKVSWNSRLRTTAGRANKYSIDLSPGVFQNMTAEDQFDTVSHEFAHTVHCWISGKTDHGRVWQSIHRAMGGTAERCHNTECKHNKRKRHVYVDSISGKVAKVSTRVHNDLMCHRRVFKKGTNYKYTGYEVYQGKELLNKVMF